MLNVKIESIIESGIILIIDNIRAKCRAHTKSLVSKGRFVIQDIQSVS